MPEIIPDHDFSNINICDKAEIIKIKGFKIDEAFAEMVAKKASQLTAKIEALKVAMKNFQTDWTNQNLMPNLTWAQLN